MAAAGAVTALYMGVRAARFVQGRLMLYGAQQALLQGSVPTYQQNLKAAQRLLKDNFDVESQIIVAMQAELNHLQSMKILTDMPDITASLATLRRLGERSEAP